MTKKSLLYPLYFLLLISASLSANFAEENEKAFYALSSLRFYLDEKLTNSQPIEKEENKIQFCNDDLVLLWSRAKDCDFERELNQAELDFWNANDSDREESREQLQKVKDIVDEIWTQLNPLYVPLHKGILKHRYLLPEDHWLKEALDGIFYKGNALENHDTFSEAGFNILCKRTSKMIVAEHDDLPGYLVKCLLECDKPHQSWKWMCNRCEGAENIRVLIKKKGLKHFIVPDKWIYRLPNYPETKSSFSALSRCTDPALLVVTRMNIGSYDNSRRAWKEKVTHSVLRELYCILSHGYASLYLILNIPYTKEGKFACLDTEFPWRRFNYDKVYHYLSAEMKLYWEILVKTGGHP